MIGVLRLSRAAGERFTMCPVCNGSILSGELITLVSSAYLSVRKDFHDHIHRVCPIPDVVDQPSGRIVVRDPRRRPGRETMC